REWGVLAFFVFIFVISNSISMIPDWVGLASLFGYIILQGLMTYSATTIGSTRRVNAKPVRDDEQVRCDVCGCHIGEKEGEHRMYSEQQVLFGVPIRTTDWGENVYCAGCESPVTDVAKSTCESTTPYAFSDEPAGEQSQTETSSNRLVERE